MAQLEAIVQYLNQLLDPLTFQDSSYNDLQVDSGQNDVSLIAFSVDAGLSVIEKAIQEKAQLLCVHHGLLWGELGAVSGTFGKKIRTLIQGGCSLYASHLPLDANREVGNNYELARFYGLEGVEQFAPYHGQLIGAKGFCPAPLPMEYFVQKSRELPGASEPHVLSFGKNEITSVGIVSGGAADSVHDAARDNLDLFITGEPRHDIWHVAKELGINVIFAGHYATETAGILALKSKLEKDLGIGTVFIHEPTGM